MRAKCAAFLIFCAVLSSGCASRSSVIAPRLTEGASASPVELIETPFFPQKSYQCGPAALATVLQSSGVNVVPQDLVSQVYIPEKKGSLQVELVAATRQYERVPYIIAPDMQALFAELRAGHPVLILQNLGLKLYPAWHYAVVIGYEPWSDRIILRSGTTQREMMKASKFLRSWRHSNFWGMVALNPGDLPAVADRDAYLKAVAGLEASGKTDAALLSYKASLQRWPQSELALLGIGNSHYARGEFAEAEKMYQQLLKVNSDHDVAVNNLALVLSEQGCYDAALAEIINILAKDNIEASLRNAFSDTRMNIHKMRDENPGKKKSCNIVH